MWENNEIEIIECKYGEREDVIRFLVQITSEEFGFTDWKDYFEHKLVEKYKTGKNNFWIAINKENQVIGTCGGLQQTEDTPRIRPCGMQSAHAHAFRPTAWVHRETGPRRSDSA